MQVLKQVGELVLEDLVTGDLVSAEGGLVLEEGELEHQRELNHM